MLQALFRRRILGRAEQSLETSGAEFFAEDALAPLSLTCVIPAQLQYIFGPHRDPGWGSFCG
jgi:hypothetical protein